MQPRLLCVIIVKCVFLVWDSAQAHLLSMLSRTKQKKKWQQEEQFLSIKGYWEFNYLSCEVFQGCGQLIRVIMHRVRGDVHGAQGGGCCCSLKRVGSSLFPDTSTPTLSEADEEVSSNRHCSYLCCAVRRTQHWTFNAQWNRTVNS